MRKLLLPVEVDRCICHYHIVKHLPSFSVYMEAAQACFFFSEAFLKIVSVLVLLGEVLIIFSVCQYVFSLVHMQCKKLCAQESLPISLNKEVLLSHLVQYITLH